MTRLILPLVLMQQALGLALVRVKRQVGRPNYVQPGPFFDPFPGRDSSSLFPTFPFTATGNGAASFQRPLNNFKGFLDIPITGWNGIFDIKGSLTTGNGPIDVGVGYLVSPTNVLDINPAAASAVAANPLFQAARNDVGAIPVARLPGNFAPVSCRPPFCNPYLGNLGVGVNIEPGDDFIIDGDLDFPVPTWSPGGGVRLPIAYGGEFGSTPYDFTYGHGIGPTDFLQKSYDRQREREAREAAARALRSAGQPSVSNIRFQLALTERILEAGGNQGPLPQLSDLDRIEAARALRSAASRPSLAGGNQAPLPQLPDFARIEAAAKESDEPVTSEEFLRFAAALHNLPRLF